MVPYKSRPDQVYYIKSDWFLAKCCEALRHFFGVRGELNSPLLDSVYNILKNKMEIFLNKNGNTVEKRKNI